MYMYYGSNDIVYSYMSGQGATDLYGWIVMFNVYS